MLKLCSTSRTRALLLEKFGIEFVQEGCEFDEEQINIKDPSSFVYHAALGKAACCKKRYGLGTPLLCADTVVTARGKILRKAKDEAEAREILLTQSGRQTAIISCTIYMKPSLDFLDLSATIYRFLPFDPDHMEAYLASGEWRGKAGACMVEGFCKPYIAEVRGYESCAMGLSVEKLLPFL